VKAQAQGFLMKGVPGSDQKRGPEGPGRSAASAMAAGVCGRGGVSFCEEEAGLPLRLPGTEGAQGDPAGTQGMQGTPSHERTREWWCFQWPAPVFCADPHTARGPGLRPWSADVSAK